jgi:hypothetical protein
MQRSKTLHIPRFIIVLLGASVLSACAARSLPSAYTSSAETAPKRPAFQVIQTGAKVRILIFSDICFEGGTGQINDVCYAQLPQLSDFLKTYLPPFKIIGYSDPILGDPQGSVLAKQQAFAIATYLWTRGYSTKEVIVRTPPTFMKEDFLGSTKNVESNSVNRRVEVRNY